MNTLNELAERIHENSRAKGFYAREYCVHRDLILGDIEGRVENPSMPAEKLMLIVSECSEALEALRDGDAVAEGAEIADVIIRALDYAYWRGIDIEDEVYAKIAENEKRPYLHGRKF